MHGAGQLTDKAVGYLGRLVEVSNPYHQSKQPKDLFSWHFVIELNLTVGG